MKLKIGCLSDIREETHMHYLVITFEISHYTTFYPFILYLNVKAHGKYYLRQT